MSTLYSQLDIQEKENAMLAITGEIKWEQFEAYYQKSLEAIAKNTELDGFRKGKAPLDAVEAKVGQMTILQEAAQRALGDVYPAIIIDNKLEVIGYPQISITKIAHGSELGFFITSAAKPQVTLGNYKALAVEHNKEEVSVDITDEEVDKAVDQMRNMYAHSMAGPHTHEKGDPDAEHDLPELTDEFVQNLGDFKTVDEFKKQIKSELEAQKNNEAKAKRREAMIMAIVKDAKFDLPDVLVEAEKDKMLGAMKDDVARMGLEYDKWLEHSGKTEEDIRKEMHSDAVDRAGAELILKEIAQAENLQGDEEKISAHVEEVKKVHKDIPEENIRMYVENMYLNEAVLSFLEAQKS